MGEISLEQSNFAKFERFDLRICFNLGRRKFDCAETVALGQQSGPSMDLLCELGLHNGELRAGLRVLETEHHLSEPDRVAFAHQDLADNAAIPMLDLLEVLVNDDRALGYDGPGELRGDGPTTRSAHQEQSEKD